MDRRNAMKRLGAGGVASVVAGTGLEGALLRQPVPSSQEAKVREREAERRLRRISLREYQDRVHGAWLGGIAGTLFGMPFEGKPQNVMARLDRFLSSYVYAPVDDDYYYEMVALYGFERHGIGMTVEQLGQMWK